MYSANIIAQMIDKYTAIITSTYTQSKIYETKLRNILARTDCVTQADLITTTPKILAKIMWTVDTGG